MAMAMQEDCPLAITRKQIAKRKYFKKLYSSERFSVLLSNCILDLLEGNGTARALALAISYRYSNFRSVDPSLLKGRHPDSYDSAHDYLLDSQAIAFFKKAEFLDQDDKLKENAINSFFAIESRNREFNKQLSSRKCFRANSIINTAGRIIKRVLGCAPDPDSFSPMFGPGASFSSNATLSTLVHKVEGHADVTLQASALFSVFTENYPELFSGVVMIPGNKFSTVPKDSFKLRTICKEGVGNMLLQKNIGSVIRKKLRRVGIDLETQQHFHKTLVKDHWEWIATLDQSDASDNICYELVKELFYFCPDWWHLLNATRSTHTEINGELVKLEKFMSQGNGFTFELETLIFYAITQAAIVLERGEERFCSVYGDDVIIASSDFEAVREAYILCGFTLNENKTFTNGNFRESCGSDTFRGIEVRPVFFKGFTESIYGFYELANRVWATAKHDHFGDFASIRYRRAWLRCIHSLQERHRSFGCETFGDAVLHGGDTSVYKHSKRCSRILSDERFTPNLVHPTKGVIAYALLGGDSEGTLKRNPLRIPCFRRGFPVNRASETLWV